MALNPNVPYEVFQGGQYVGLPSSRAPQGSEAPFITAVQYKALEERYSKLSYDTREILGKVAWAAGAPKFSRNDSEDPLAGMSPARRDLVIADMKKHNIGWYNEKDKTFGLEDDDKTIVRDLRAGKKGFNTPIYNVGGNPVVSEHFDDAGNLSKPVAKSRGVPSERSAAIAARPTGIRSTLLQAAKKPAMRLTAPTLPR
ncbi:MAG: hypothetical protein Q8K65_02395 [Alphaproteobacteria bacterium]|nr:hypothetical protein [Alphaproteobacteria bacterium]